MTRYYGEPEKRSMLYEIRVGVLMASTGCISIMGIMWWNDAAPGLLWLLFSELVIGTAVSVYFLEIKKNLELGKLYATIYSVSLVMSVSLLMPSFRFESLFFLHGLLVSFVITPDRNNRYFFLYVFLLVGNSVYEAVTVGGQPLTLFNEIILIVVAIYMVPSIIMTHRAYRVLTNRILLSQEELLSRNEELAISESKLKVANQKLNNYIDKSLDLERFTHLASHELQTPLLKLDNFSQLLQESLGDRISGKEKTFLDFIQSGNRELQNRIRIMLEMSLMLSRDLDKEFFSFKDLLDECLREEKNLMEKANITIGTLPDYVHADRSLLRKVLKSMISNSYYYRSLDRQLVFEVGCTESETFWEFYVRDNGIGIEEEYIDQIFLLFKRLHIDSEIEGDGFGLTLSKKVIELHGGEIRVESSPDSHTVFYFTLPKMRQNSGVKGQLRQIVTTDEVLT